MPRPSKLATLQEMEKQLSTELTRLRAAIRAARKNENTRIKNTAKYIARKGREMARVAESQRKIQEQELERIEKTLGETFETLVEAREALTKQTRKPTKRELLAYHQIELRKAQESLQRAETEKQRKRRASKVRRLEYKVTGKTPPRLNPKRQAYTVRELSEYEKQRVIDFLTDRKSFNSLGDGYLAPNERVTVSVPYKYHDANGRMRVGQAVGKKVFDNWNDLRRYIMHYGDGTQDSELDDWLGSIGVMKFPTEEEYYRASDRFTDFKERTNKAALQGYKAREKRKIKEAKEKGKEIGRREAERKLRKQQKKGW